jgi:hypothetical protein
LKRGEQAPSPSLVTLLDSSSETHQREGYCTLSAKKTNGVNELNIYLSITYAETILQRPLQIGPINSLWNWLTLELLAAFCRALRLAPGPAPP